MASSDVCLTVHVLGKSNLKENVIYSPFSIAIAAGMVKYGSRGQTLNQIDAVFNDDFLKAAKDGMLTLKNTSGASICISSANKAWIRDGLPILQPYIDHLVQEYSASINRANFQNRSAQLVQSINDWIAKETHNRISDILQPDTINALTALVLVNAIYFKGTWKKQFSSESSRLDIFNLDKSSSVSVDFMYQEEMHGYTRVGSTTIVRLGYESDLPLSMYIMLPDDIEGVESISKDFKILDKHCTSEETRATKIKLYLPKFKIDQSLDLVQILKELGIQDLFGEDCDLSGIAGKKGDLVVSAMLHRATVEVNEVGTEAAAATVVVARLRSVRPVRQPPLIKCDRPFVFTIKLGQQTMFVGRLSNPK